MIMFEKQASRVGLELWLTCYVVGGELNGWLKFIPVKGTFQLQCGISTVWQIYY